MAKLFLDVDDTLIHWPNEIGQGEAEVDNWLPSDVLCFLSTHEYELVVWSGQGIQYAQKWGQEIFRHTPFTVHYKDMRVPQFPDVVVDDDDVRPRDKRVRVVKDLRTCPICNPILTR